MSLTDEPAWLESLNPFFDAAEASLDDAVLDPIVSPALYGWRRRVALGKRVAAMQRIYLDQRFWIFCRDAKAGSPAKRSHTELFNLLRKGVKEGAFVCPASYPILSEALKVGDNARRRATTEVIDELSTGIALQQPKFLIHEELFDFLHRNSGGKQERPPLVEHVWTFPALIHGDVFPEMKGFPQKDNTTIGKKFLQMISFLPLSVTVDAMAHEGMTTLDSAADIDALNDAVRTFQHEVTSYEAVFDSEVAGILDASSEALFAAVSSYFHRETGLHVPKYDSAEGRESVRLLQSLIYTAVRLGKLKTELPFLFIGASIHASLRHRRQPFRMGDPWDHMHAHSALGYCHAFFTERSLGNLLKSRPALLSESFNVPVFWSEDDAISYLRSLTTS